MSSPTQMQDLVARHKALALAIAREFPDADEETLLDTIEGASDLPSFLGAVLRSRSADLTLAEALHKRIEVLRKRLQRIKAEPSKSGSWSPLRCRRPASRS